MHVRKISNFGFESYLDKNVQIWALSWQQNTQNLQILVQIRLFSSVKCGLARTVFKRNCVSHTAHWTDFHYFYLKIPFSFIVCTWWPGTLIFWGYALIWNPQPPVFTNKQYSVRKIWFIVGQIWVFWKYLLNDLKTDSSAENVT